MSLYNCRHDGDQYRMTKFDSSMNVESSYLCTFDECECPAGAAPTCRHRRMLPLFLERGTIDSMWMYDHDRGGWVSTEIDTDLVPGRIRDPQGVPESDPIQTHATRRVEPEGLPPSISEPAISEPAKPLRRL